MADKFITLPGGAKMPVVGLGTCQNGVEDALEKAMEAAFQSGYRHFDTAFIYNNEAIVGKVISRWINKGLVERKDLFITTKLPMFGIHPDRVELFLDKSLKNLGLDYVDLYLIHFPVCFKYDAGTGGFSIDNTGVFLTEPTDHVAVWKKMEEMVDAGKSKHIGLSNFNSQQISKILDKARIKPANLQVEIHPYLQNKELVEFCKEKGISVVAYSPFASPAIHVFLQSVGLPSKETPKVLEDPLIVSIAQKHSKTSAQVILRYALQRGLAVIPKSVSPARIEQNIDVFDFELDQMDVEAIAKLDKGEEGRVCVLDFKGVSAHPEYPHKLN